MDAMTIERAADWIADARFGGRAVSELPPELRPTDIPNAYAIQCKLLQRLMARGDGALIGWKVGATTAPMQKLLNLSEPAAGAMLASAEKHSPATLRFADYRKIGIECEVCVKLKSPLPAGAGKVDREAAAAAVDSLFPAMEIVDNRYGDFVKIGAPTIIADNVFHSAIVLGTEVKDWQKLDLVGCDGTTAANGEVKLRGKGADVLGHPFESLAWLANLLGARGERLEAGQYVMTGSLPLPYWANFGETVEINITGLGSVNATLS